MLNTGVSANKVAMSILREIFWLSAVYNFYLTGRHIRGTHNYQNDKLSRVFSRNIIQESLLPFMCCRQHSG